MPDPAAPRVDYQAVFNTAPGSYLLLAPDLTIVAVNDAYLAATMTVRETIVGRGLFDVFPDDPNDPNATGVRNLRASLERAIAGRRPDRMPLQRYPIRRPDGGFEERFWSPLNTPVLGPAGQVRYLIHWVEDVTELVRLKEQTAASASQIEAEVYLRTEAMEANRRLAESETRLRFLTDAVPQIIWTAAPDGRIEYCNERWTDWTGLPAEAALGDGWLAALHPDDREAAGRTWALSAATGAERHEMAQRVRVRDGSYRWMLSIAVSRRDTEGRVLRWYGCTTDIHDRVTAEQQWRQAQRLQAAGKLAGGVAHEVNNMMTVVLGFGEMLRGQLAADLVRDDLEQMILAAERASNVTRQLLAYSRQQQLNPAVLDLRAVVGELVPALERVIGTDRRLTVTEGWDRMYVRADRGQIEQVLINLVANARDATGTDGEIRIELDGRPVDRALLDRQHETDIPPGQFACCRVSDRGVGMDPETVGQVFEPFFTTKAVGKGTGLGLSMVYGIVKQHGGFVTIESALGRGTTVSVHLPLSAAPVAADETAEPFIAAHGSGCVLVVEDEPMVRGLARRALELYGYQVMDVPDGESALELLEREAARVDLVLTDVVMPHMTGKELADQIRTRYPKLPVLFMTGYSGEDIQRRGLIVTGVRFVQKPFTPEGLADAVGRALTGETGDRSARDPLARRHSTEATG